LNYLSLNDYRRAIQLALSMEQPGRLLSLFGDVQSKHSEDSVSGQASVDEVLRTLSSSDLAKLLRFVRDWNSNAKTSMVAQGIFYAIIKLRPASDLMQAFSQEAAEATGNVFGDTTKAKLAGGTGLREVIDALIPYTERHLSRMEKLVQESYMVDYILAEMDGGMLDEKSDNGMDID
jgi:U3 small nucleolar RNA-associated protein 13